MIEFLTFVGYSCFVLIAGMWLGEWERRNRG
jgi:hypothetical protein